MGLSASQGRLLSLTARLTSNEYESQQISNAKMRLATQSEEASSEYIAALNSQQMLFVSYDAQGQAIKENLTASSLYQYSEMKNQYVLSNSAGQALLASDDIANFKKADNLDDFLAAYGIKKIWKSASLETNYNTMQDNIEYKKAWDNKIAEIKGAQYDEYDASGQKTGNKISAEEQWRNEKMYAEDDYMNAMAEYEEAETKIANGISVDNISELVSNLSDTKQAYTNTITFNAWATARATYGDPEVKSDGSRLNYIYDYSARSTEYENLQKYNTAKAEFDAEAEDYGSSMDDLYVYEDSEKAQWYTNLWYRMNGESTNKSIDGENGTYYTQLDSKLMTSSTWIKDALSQGLVSIEKASNTDSKDVVNNGETPTILQLKGIKWNTTIYSNCSDFTTQDDDQAIAKAEAVYTRKTEEINAKDEKYQSQIKNLETEHSTLQTEYESVQSALNKNIERSYKTFNA